MRYQSALTDPLGIPDAPEVPLCALLDGWRAGILGGCYGRLGNGGQSASPGYRMLSASPVLSQGLADMPPTTGLRMIPRCSTLLSDDGFVDRRALAVQVAEELLAEGRAAAVLLHGSVARETDRPDSDLDLLVVQAGTRSLRRWVSGDDVVVEAVSDSPAGWASHLGAAQPMWVYAWLEGDILVDPMGVAAELKTKAEETFRHYRTPDPIRTELNSFWDHVRPKALVVRARADPAECGFTASALFETVVQAAFAVKDQPLPPGSLRFPLMCDLTRGHPEERRFISMLTAKPLGRLEAVIDLLDLYLQPPQSQ